MTINALLFRIAKKHGITKLGEELGINQNTFKNKINPNMDTHHIYPEEIDLIATIVNTDEIAQYFAEQRGLMCIKKPDFEGLSDSSILDLFLTLQKEQGAWAKRIGDALSDGEIYWDELHDIRKEYDAFILAAAEIMSRLEAYMGTSEQNKARKLVAGKMK